MNSYLWKFRLLLAFVLLCWLSGCQEVKNTVSSETEGIVEPDVKWPAKEVTVCWGNPSSSPEDFLHLMRILFGWKETSWPTVSSNDWSESEKETIKTSVNRNFKSDSTGISFGGWSACRKSEVGLFQKEPLVVILRVADPRVSETPVLDQTTDSNALRIGIGSAKKQGNQYVYLPDSNGNYLLSSVLLGADRMCQYFKKPFEKCAPFIALHEFGHIVGLRHEHVHPDAQKDPLCRVDLVTGTAQNGFHSALAKENLGDSARVSNYDKSSVMNYCHLFATLRGDPRSGLKEAVLTRDEIAAVRSLYEK
jgi:hypothetical protein